MGIAIARRLKLDVKTVRRGYSAESAAAGMAGSRRGLASSHKADDKSLRDLRFRSVGHAAFSPDFGFAGGGEGVFATREFREQHARGCRHRHRFSPAEEARHDQVEQVPKRDRSQDGRWDQRNPAHHDHDTGHQELTLPRLAGWPVDWRFPRERPGEVRLGPAAFQPTARLPGLPAWAGERRVR